MSSNGRKLRPHDKIAACDPIWSALRDQAEQLAESEKELSSFAHATILKHERLEQALSYHLAKKIGGEDLSPMQVRAIFEEAFIADPSIGEAVRADLSAVFQRDPACHSYIQAFLFFKGFHSLQSHRIAHWLWRNQRHSMAYFFQHRVSELFAVDIHPAAKLGRGIMIDHATGVVIGETSHLGSDVKMYQGVTLGALSHPRDENGRVIRNVKRHPTVEDNVTLYANATVLGGSTVVGAGSVIGGSVFVTRSVPQGSRVAMKPPELRVQPPGGGRSAPLLSASLPDNLPDFEI